MIRAKTYLPKYGITIYSYFKKTCINAEEIIERLYFIGARGRVIQQAKDNLRSCELNSGLCYYNPQTRAAVMVVSDTSEASQTLNSLFHELWHLMAYISRDLGMSPYEEPIAYLLGSIAQDLYPKISKLLCNCCREHEDER